MKTLILLFLPLLSIAQQPRDTLSIVNITFQDTHGNIFTPHNLWRLNFRDSTTLVVRHTDSSRDYFYIRDAQVHTDTADIPIYRFIPLYTDRVLKQYLKDSSAQLKVKFIIQYR